MKSKIKRLDTITKNKARIAFHKWKEMIEMNKTINIQKNNNLAQRVKYCCKNLDILLVKLKKNSFDTWKNLYLKENIKELLVNLNLKKLQVLLEKITRRKLRDAAQRLLGEGNRDLLPSVILVCFN